MIFKEELKCKREKNKANIALFFWMVIDLLKTKKLTNN